MLIGKTGLIEKTVLAKVVLLKLILLKQTGLIKQIWQTGLLE